MSNASSLQQPPPSATTTTKIAPSYEERCRIAKVISQLSPEEKAHAKSKTFVPRSIKDYHDGGAFPEIHVAQYPRNMGNPHLRRQLTPNLMMPTISNNNNTKVGTAGSNQNNQKQQNQLAVVAKSNVMNVDIDQDGKVSYDSIVKGGTNSNKLVYTKLSDMKGGKANESDIALPSRDEEQEEAEHTNQAFMMILQQKMILDKPSGTAIINSQTSQNIEQKTKYIKYSANESVPGYNPSASANRIIQMIPKQIDPLMPPKHKHLKAPRGPAEDPVPILQAPPKKLTKEEREQWNIPACISNWKNARGYTIPLDKRLAADGRGLIDRSINSDQFAALSESLYVAEQQARQEVRMRALIQKKQLLQERNQREEDLRQLANQARLERNQIQTTSTTTKERTIISNNQNDNDDNRSSEGSSSSESFHGIVSSKSQSSNNRQQHPTPSAVMVETDDDIAARQRDKLRMERKKERERELRMERNMELKRKQKFEEERDVSEKIALGVHVGTGGDGGGIDSRLYNQSSGMDSGFAGGDDEYNIYTKPLFGSASSTTANSQYRPSRGDTLNEYNADEHYDKLVNDGITSKFQADKGFAGAGGKGYNMPSSQPRTLPVQFEREQASSK